VLGEWWVEDSHWFGLVPEVTALPYAIKGDLLHIPGTPYCHLEYDDLGGLRTSLSACMTMWLMACGAPEISCYQDYVDCIPTADDLFFRQRHKDALSSLGFAIKFSASADYEHIKSELEKGSPVIAGLFCGGTVSDPTNAGHHVLITGYNNDSWLVHDPFGELDLSNGFWKDQSFDAGQNVLYNFEEFELRWAYGGGASGHCWTQLSKIEP